MITLKCTTPVIMTDGSVAFKAGESYQFRMNAHGEISRTTERGVHMFRASGDEAWTNYFKYEMEV